MTRVFGSVALGCALLFSFVAPRAEEIRDYYAEPGINPFKESINQHFNEHVDPFSGTLQLKYTDLSIPGNGGMDINVTRVYTSLQTNEYPTLGLNGLGWTMHFGRIVISRNHADKLCNQGAYPETTLENPSLELPDGGRELLVLNHIGNTGGLITRSNWRAQCLSGGGGVLVTSPDGTRYTMNQADSFQGEPSWLTTRIEDLRGNWIRIDYNVNAAGVAYIEEIYRSEEGDGAPVVSYEYESEATADIKLSAISANGQRISYRYETIPGFLHPFYRQLVEVVRPDNASWRYTYNPKFSDPDPNDGVLQDGPASFSLNRVAYPHGAAIDYTYQWVAFDPGSPQKTTSIHTKAVSGTGVTGGTWTYTFAPHSHSYPDNNGGQLRYDVTTVSGPDDILKFYHYGKDYRADAATGGNVFIRPSFVGLIALKETYGLTNALLQRTGYSWTVRPISTEDFRHGAGYRSWWRDCDIDIGCGTFVPMLTAEYSDRDSRAPIEGYLHYVQYFEYDIYGNPHRVYESSSLIDRPPVQKRLTYHIDTTKWILHLVKDEVHEEVDRTVRTIGEIEREYDANGLLLEQNALGIRTGYTYTQRGDVETIEDARGKVRSYSNYKRGIPRLEQLPESVTIQRTVNNTGTVASQTNGRGFTTSFDYDGLNRLTGIDFPIKADVSIGYGTAAGGYRRTLTRGNYRQAEVINDFGQVTRTERSDVLSGQLIYRSRGYDASGRETFLSYPNATIGITTTYDALGRVRRTQHPDGTGVSYAFDDLRVDVTNERGFVTTYVSQVRGVDFGSQSLAFIGAPQNVGTIIRKDSFDNTTLVFQGEWLGDSRVFGHGREYEYDSRNFLIRATEPEVGVTVYTHDALGNVLSERVNDAEPVLFGYDDLNRRTSIDFSGSEIDVATLYDRNDNVREVAKGTSRWVYGYDENDNLLTEALSIADPLFGARSYLTRHDYNAQDVLRQMTYPSGLEIDYAPDAFGRATRAGTFASNITYHPSGQLQSYRMGNGVVTNVALNARLLTQNIQTGSLVNLGYTYDPVGNVTAIVDGIDSSRTVEMSDPSSYDGLDRLVNATGAWGSARFTYDFYGNIVTKSVGSDNLSNQFDERLRLVQVKKLNAFNTEIEDARTRMDFDTRGNATAKRRYTFDIDRRLQSLNDMRFTYAADSTLVKARVTDITQAQSAPIVDKEYLYDGNGQRFVEKKHGTYDIRYSVYGSGGQLLFEDSIADCTRTDYIRLGALTLARSDDRRADPALDSDSDQINNCMELQLGLNPNNAADANADGDGDGLSNLQELRFGTSLLAADTDRDGLSDLQETNQYLSDPTLADSDGDGIADGTEALDPRLDPMLADADHDGVSDGWELQLGTNPQDILDGRLDTDGDGFSNRQESLVGSNPLSRVISPARGAGAWTFETFGEIHSSAAIGPTGVIYQAAQSEYLFAINPDGTQRWRYEAPGGTVGPPTVAPNGTIYVLVNGVLQNEIHAINPDGTLQWTHASDKQVMPSLALGPNGQVYYAGFTTIWQDGNYVDVGAWEALNESGEVVSSGEFSGAVGLGPTVGVNGDVYVFLNSGDLLAFDEQGALRWTLAIGQWPGQAPVLDAMQRIYVADLYGAIYAVSSQGDLLWTRASVDNESRSSVTIGADGTLYIGAYDSKLYAVNPVDGSTIWTANTYGTSYTPAVAADGTIFVTTWGGSISAFDPLGTLIWRYLTDTEMSAPPVIDRDGTLYAGSRMGQLFAVVDNNGGLAKTPWPMYRHDPAGSSYVCFDSAAYSSTVDSDGDGIDDCSELKHGLDPANPNDAAADLDADGLSNAQEHAAGTSMSNPDTDADGLSDGQEVLRHHTNPLRADSDADSIGDGQEIQYGLNPLDAADALLDADGDGFSNRAEAWAGTDLSDNGSRPVPGTVASVIEGSAVGRPPIAIAPDGTMYRLTEEQNIEALDPNFKLKWRRTLDENTRALSIAADGTLYTSTSYGDELVALYSNGRDRWRYLLEQDGTNASIIGAPVIGSDGTLFVVIVGYRPGDQYNYHQIAAIDPRGRLKWRVETDYRIVAPAISLDRDGNVVAHSMYEGAAKHRGDDGELIWSGSGDNFIHHATPPVIDVDNTIYVSNYYGLRALDPSDGSVRWHYSNVSGQTVITPSGLILQACGQFGQATSLCAITRDGNLAWTAQTPGYDEVVVGKNGVIYLNTSQALFAYDQDGARLWDMPFPIEAWGARAVILNDGMIYLSDWDYRALVISDSFGLADSPWPAVNRDYNNSRNALGVVDVPPSAAPTLGITSPNPFVPLNLEVGEPFTLTAYASDAVDGDLSSAIVWTSNLDGTLGQGGTLDSRSLSVGTHVITASVADSDGLTALDTITINSGNMSWSAAVASLGARQHGSHEAGVVIDFAGAWDAPTRTVWVHAP